MEFDFYAIGLIAFLTSTVQCNNFLEMSQISQDLEEVLRSVNRTTITSCHMICSRETKCNAIGLTKRSGESPLYNCHLLKKKIDVKREPKNVLKMIKVKNLTESKAKPEIKWKRYTFVGCNKRPIEYKKLMDIGKRTLQYQIQLEVMRTKFETQMGWIVHLTTGASFVPYISFSAGKSGLLISNRNPYVSCSSKVEQPLNKWITVNVNQTKEGDEYIYRVSVDGERIFMATNVAPIRYHDVKVFLGSTGYKQAGFVRNFWMMVEE